MLLNLNPSMFIFDIFCCSLEIHIFFFNPPPPPTWQNVSCMPWPLYYTQYSDLNVYKKKNEQQCARGVRNILIWYALIANEEVLGVHWLIIINCAFLVVQHSIWSKSDKASYWAGSEATELWKVCVLHHAYYGEPRGHLSRFMHDRNAHKSKSLTNC